jgi:hypothetical protein
MEGADAFAFPTYKGVCIPMGFGPAGTSSVPAHPEF